MHNIYNLIVGQTNEHLQYKAASEATFQAVKTDQYLIGYLMILKRICLSNQSEQHPICSLYLSTRRMYNTMQYANENITDYLIRFRNIQRVNEATLLTLDQDHLTNLLEQRSNCSNTL